MPDLRLKGKNALITGASRGLGKEIAIGFAKEGANILINFLENKSAALETQKLIEEQGVKSSLYQGDVSIKNNIEKIIERGLNDFNNIDILVNNAGINRRGFLKDITEEEWDEIMNVNLKGPFLLSQIIFPIMIKQGGGRIINISSVASQYYGPKTVHYAVSKSGLNCLTKVLARYGAPHNILVNSVAPGLILTDQTKDEFKSGNAKPLIDLTLLKKPGLAKDVVATCLLLAENNQNYITGQVLSVSGGAYLG